MWWDSGGDYNDGTGAFDDNDNTDSDENNAEEWKIDYNGDNDEDYDDKFHEATFSAHILVKSEVGWKITQNRCIYVNKWQKMRE